MKKIITLFSFFCLSLFGSAQISIREISVGDTCPDLAFTGVLNHSTGTLRLSGYKNKLVLFDFVSVNCTSCIAAFPHLQDLQRQFSNKLQIIVVAKDNTESWNKLVQRNKIAAGLKLPIILGDSILSSYFRYEYVTHVVWLSGNRRVAAITSGNYISSSNIEKMIAGAPVNLPLKKDVGDYTFQSPMAVLSEPAYFMAPVTYSIFTGYRPGTQTAVKSVVDAANNVVRNTFINQPILSFYKQAFKKAYGDLYRPNRLVVEVDDSSLFFRDNGEIIDEWREKNYHCYEAVLPMRTGTPETGKIMLEDLNRYTRYYGRKEKKLLSCYVITRSTQLPPLASEPVSAVSDTGYDRFEVYPAVSDLVMDLNRFSAMLPVIDETGITKKLNIRLPGTARTKIEQIRKILAAYGLQVSKEEREIDAFVISEK